ncbi:nuclear transport factor 2 family protein [Streptomyces sp. NPDC048639]|uniref:nuclear transport factor 2 family protein n=1 Tax=Streptomyces sp. NPDC048639 TaxID=3365581 RepID=UPI00372431BD
MEDEATRDAIDMFFAAINTSNSVRTSEFLAQALTSDVEFWGPLGPSGGIEAVEQFIAHMRQHPDGPGVMERTTGVDIPGEWARYGWRYRSPLGEDLLSGTDVVHLRKGRIDRIVVFAGEMPPLT